jgi:hypothetical protein
MQHGRAGPAGAAFLISFSATKSNTRVWARARPVNALFGVNRVWRTKG